MEYTTYAQTPSSARERPLNDEYGYSHNKEAMHDQLDAARRDWAALSAKRQRRLFDRRIEGYNATRDRYNELVIECQKLDLADELAAEPDVTQRRLRVAEYWLNEQNVLRDETKNTVEGKRTWKFAHAFSEFLNSGSPRMRIVKGMALGFGIGIAGSMLGGVLGAATIGGGIVAAGRFARGYFARHKGGIDQLNMNAEEMLSRIGEEHSADDEDFVQALREESSSLFDRAGKKEQNKQRVAFAWGVGSVAIGAAAGWAFAGGHWGGMSVAHADTGSGSHVDVGTGKGLEHTNLGTSTTHADVTGSGSAEHVDVSATDQAHADTGTAETHAHTDVTGKTDASSTSHADVGKTSDVQTVETGSEKSTFIVEHGHGISREIRDYAELLGYKNVSPDVSYKMYQIILEEHGKNGIIDVHDIAKDTYLHGTDVRIGAPGEASWRSGVGEDLQKLFQAHQNGQELSSSVLEHGSANHVDVTATGDASTPNATSADISQAHVSTGAVESHHDVLGTGDSTVANATSADIANAGVGHVDVTTSGTSSVEVWKGAPTEQVLQKLYGGSLSNGEAHRAINELYDKFGSTGVFKGLTLSEHTPNDIWIDQDHGQVKLTNQAFKYLENRYGETPLDQSYYDLAV